MENPINITLYYHENKPCAVIFNGKVMWDSGIAEKTLLGNGEGFMQIDVALPWQVAINFCTTFCRGVSVEILKETTRILKERIIELTEIEERSLELDLSLGLDW